MRSIAATRSAAAVAIASLAAAGLAGTAEAAPKMSGSVIKKSTLSGDRLKANTLTGVQINEARLGVVPVAKLASFAELARSAEYARTAGYAETANTANSARTAETARTAESARTAETATTAGTAADAQKLNGRDHTAFLSNATRTIFAESPAVPDGSGRTMSVSCNPDEKATSGGGGWFQANRLTSSVDVQVASTVPLPLDGGSELTGWRVSGRNMSGADRFLRVYVTCVPKTVA